jgi:mucin-19
VKKLAHRFRLIPARFGVAAMAAVISAAIPAPAFSGGVPTTLTKSFSPTTIGAAGTTVLTFTVTNPAGSPALSNIGFTDTLPSGLVVANPPAVSGTCSNAAAATIATGGTNTIAVTNLQVPAGASSCTVTVNVTNVAGQFNADCTGDPAAFTNTAANLSAVTNVLNSAQPSCLVVVGQTLTKSFLPTTINAGGTTVLRFTVTNPAGSPAVSNIGFTDTLPSGLVVGNPPAVGGTCANAAAATIATAGTNTIAVSNLQVPAGASSCTVTVNVTNAAGQFNADCTGNPAAFTNTSANLSAVTNVLSTVVSSCLVVAGQPTATATSTPTNTRTGTPTSTPTSTSTRTPTSVPPTSTPTIVGGGGPAPGSIPTLSGGMLALLAVALAATAILLVRRS